MYDNCNWFQQVNQWSGELLHNLELLFENWTSCCLKIESAWSFNLKFRTGPYILLLSAGNLDIRQKKFFTYCPSDHVDL